MPDRINFIVCKGREGGGRGAAISHITTGSELIKRGKGGRVIGTRWIKVASSIENNSLKSLLGELDQLFNFVVVEHLSLTLIDDHDLDVLVTRLNHVQQSLHNQFEPFLVGETFLVMLLHEFAHLL